MSDGRSTVLLAADGLVHSDFGFVSDFDACPELVEGFVLRIWQTEVVRGLSNG